MYPIIQGHVQLVIPIRILAETTVAKVAKKRTTRFEMVLSVMGAKSEWIANAAKETNSQNAQIHHVNQVCFCYIYSGVKLK